MPTVLSRLLSRRRVLLFAVLVASACFIPWELGYAYLAPLPETVRQAVEEAPSESMDGIIVYVDQAGHEPMLYAAGWRDKRSGLPAEPQALFKIASISKLYIAAAAAKLVQAGRLSLDDTLAGRMPELATRIEYAERITVRMLLQHRSGIPDFIDERGFDWGKARNSASQLALVLDRRADFEPDRRRRYSNTNYLLIGAILDKVLGYSHRDYIQASIVAPLGLTQTYGGLADADLHQLAGGRAIGYDGELKTLDYGVPGGSMVATARDVGVFLRALVDGTLLGSKEQLIYASVAPYEHTGLLPGYQSIARYHKELDVVIVQFVNTSGGNAWMKSEAIYRRILRTVQKQSETGVPSTGRKPTQAW